MQMNLNEHPQTTSHHGSIRSYVIGFILSLVFTLIPYYMVRLQLVSGTMLLIVILGFAIVQMFVQIFFFLHLGRGPKPLYNVIFFSATAGMIVLVVGASLLIMSNLYHNMSPQEYTTRLAQDENISQVGGKATGACQGTNVSHMVMVKRGNVDPGHINTHRCDTLIFMSGDNASRTLAFGSHENPVSYGGIFEVTIGSRSKSITLNQTGDFSFYDRSDYSTVGHFTVEP